jgi:hypothetical protein
MISAPNATMVDPLSVTFAGMPVQSWSYDVNGNLVLVFNTCNCNLRPGNTLALLTGKFINGAPFSQTVAVVVQ